MKQLAELRKSLQNQNYYQNQIKGVQKRRIVFINPQESGRELYKSILPYHHMYDGNTGTCFTGLTRYDVNKQITDIDMVLYASQIKWATSIIVPFTSQPMVETMPMEEGFDPSLQTKRLYSQIKEINPKAQIVFMVDFNFWEIEEGHPLHHVFSDPKVISEVEKNLFFADKVLVSNHKLYEYIIERGNELMQNKYKGMEFKVRLGVMPFFIDEKFVLENLEQDENFSSFSGEASTPPEEEFTPPTLDEVFTFYKKLAKRNKKVNPKEHAESFYAYWSAKGWKSGKKFLNWEPAARRFLNKKRPVNVDPELRAPIVEGDQNIGQETKTESPAQEPTVQGDAPKSNKKRVGVIATKFYHNDLKEFAPILKQLGESDDIELVMFGYNGDPKGENILKGIDYTYEKGVGIGHYFKKLNELQLDCIFIPLRDNIYNLTSENYNKVLEAGLLGIPVVAPNLYPYSELIQNDQKGLLYDLDESSEYPDPIAAIEHILTPAGQVYAKRLYKSIQDGWNYNETNKKFITQILS
jgi:hypothetical protein